MSRNREGYAADLVVKQYYAWLQVAAYRADIELKQYSALIAFERTLGAVYGTENGVLFATEDGKVLAVE